jgi:phosphoglycolate phosphatase
MKYEVAIFDLDGTLIDTIEDLGTAVNHALRLRSLPLHSMEEYKGMVGHGIRDLVTKALPISLQEDSSYIDSALKDFREYYSSHIDVHTRPYEGMVALLEELHSAGVRIAVASNKFQEGTERLIREFFPGVEFIAIFGNREGYPLKPDPAIVKEVLSLAGADSSKAVMVGDSRTDIRTAVAGGIDIIAVSWGFRPEEELSQALTELSPAGRLAGSVAQLREFLYGGEKK